jgi:hypothetical protein
LSDPANARPAIFAHFGKIFNAIQISWNIGSFFMSGFLANRVGFVDIINAKDL